MLLWDGLESQAFSLVTQPASPKGFARFDWSKRRAGKLSFSLPCLASSFQLASFSKTSQGLGCSSSAPEAELAAFPTYYLFKLPSSLQLLQSWLPALPPWHIGTPFYKVSPPLSPCVLHKAGKLLPSTPSGGRNKGPPPPPIVSLSLYVLGKESSKEYFPPPPLLPQKWSRSGVYK